MKSNVHDSIKAMANHISFLRKKGLIKDADYLILGEIHQNIVRQYIEKHFLKKE